MSAGRLVIAGVIVSAVVCGNLKVVSSMAKVEQSGLLNLEARGNAGAHEQRIAELTAVCVG